MFAFKENKLLLTTAALSATAGTVFALYFSHFQKERSQSLTNTSGTTHKSHINSSKSPTTAAISSPNGLPVPEASHWKWSLSSNIGAAACGAVGVFIVNYLMNGRLRRLWLGQAFRSRVIAVIPARFQSSRFPGKPLVKILGKAMIQRTWEQAKQAKTLETVVVATDDERIATFCRDFGAEVVMTSADCENGTLRCCEAVETLGYERWDAVVNIQGDEPLVDPTAIDAVVMALQEAPKAVCSTAVAPLEISDAFNFNRVKCVVDRKGYALYFSRALIPANKEGSTNHNFPYLLHLGLMCYDSAFLLQYGKMDSTPLQREEDLEQLRILEEGHKIKVVCIDHQAHGVDSPDDIQKIEAILTRKNKFSV